MAWTNGNSRTSTPAWRKLRKHVIERDGNVCRRCGADGAVVALEVDHVMNVTEGGTDDPANAQLLCKPCHTPKTRAETLRGTQRRHARLKLPTPKHPGLK
ncbi:HNH endonuclease [Rhodococcus tibetensis]|uniref:HNH endonuclease n=1 Tax=Rhodococcus tibetensis TaxID=2965064 RepID=UPI0035ABE3EA